MSNSIFASIFFLQNTAALRFGYNGFLLASNYLLDIGFSCYYKCIVVECLAVESIAAVSIVI